MTVVDLDTLFDSPSHADNPPISITSECEGWTFNLSDVSGSISGTFTDYTITGSVLTVINANTITNNQIYVIA